MPWRVMMPMSQRREFVEDAARGLYAMTELCARYGISRKTGYTWCARYAADGPSGLADQRRIALRGPHRMPDEIAARLVACRQAQPTWGPRTLLAYLARRHPRVACPAARSVGALLKRHGLVRARRRRPAPGHPGRPMTPMEAPNVVWTADFKGQCRTRDGVYCYPLTIVDGYSRYLLACRGLPSVETRGARSVFERLFRERGYRSGCAATTASPSRPAPWAGSPSSRCGGSGSGSRPSSSSPARRSRTGGTSASTGR
ncbi:MAG TPA: helix-turn-helix domain-containing protein [Gemmatimonadaceae bacterium]|nr:helix-turn-helix domain-containing protein [Gemmatimonadaceae bacterium]